MHLSRGLKKTTLAQHMHLPWIHLKTARTATALNRAMLLFMLDRKECAPVLNVKVNTAAQ